MEIEIFEPKIVIPNKVGIIYKNLYETPLSAIKRFREIFGIKNAIKLAYAGRLDPLAEGLLVVLIGDECKKRDDYQKLDKTYVFEIILGLSTDSDDSLGRILKYSPKTLEFWHKFLSNINEDYIQTFSGDLLLKPPLLSAVRINGKPLYELYRKGLIKSLADVSEIDMSIKSIRKIFKTRFESEEFVLNEISERLRKIIGDFRQDDIQNDILGLDSMKDRYFVSMTFVADVKSGTYIRSIAREFGNGLGIPAIAWKIKRTRVGEFGL